MANWGNFDTSKLRRYLLDHFSDDEMRVFCMDVPKLRPTLHEFSSGMGFTKMVNVVVDYCIRTDYLVELVNKLQEVQPDTALPQSAFILVSEPTGLDPKTSRNSKNWSYPETKLYASDDLIEILDQQRDYQLLAIDHGLMLYTARAFRPIDFSNVFVSKRLVREEEELHQPDRQTLRQRIVEAEIEDSDVEAYIKKQLPVAVASKRYQTKLGIHQLQTPNSVTGEPLTLSIVPLSYWIVDNFNRKLLREPDEELKGIRRRALLQIAGSAETITQYTFPSALYAEYAIITSDDKLAFLEKSGRLSALANYKGRRWTCSIEEGFSWKNTTIENNLDFDHVTRRCVTRELGVNPDLIASMNVYGVALECTHLNSAFVGVLKINISSYELESKAAESEDYGLSAKFIPMNEVAEAIFLKPCISIDEMHPTARLRSLLALYECFGSNKARKMIGLT